MNLLKKFFGDKDLTPELLTDVLVTDILGGPGRSYISYNYDNQTWSIGGDVNLQYLMPKHETDVQKLKSAIDATDFGKTYDLVGYIILDVWVQIPAIHELHKAVLFSNPLHYLRDMPLAQLKKSPQYQKLYSKYESFTPGRASAVKLIARDKKNERIIRTSDNLWVKSMLPLADVRALNSSLRCGAIMPGYQNMLIQTAINGYKCK